MSEFKITEVSIRPFNKKDSKLKAFVDITICDCFVVKGFKVVDGSKGIFVGMPSTQNQTTKKWDDTAFPINSETRKYIQDTIIGEYDKIEQKQDDLFD